MKNFGLTTIFWRYFLSFYLA